MQDFGNSSALAMKLLQSCTEPSICFVCEVFRSYLRPDHYQSSLNNESPNFNPNHNMCHIIIHITTTSTMDRDKDCGITKSRGFWDAFHPWVIFTHRTRSHKCFCHGRSTQVAYDHVFSQQSFRLWTHFIRSWTRRNPATWFHCLCVK